MRNMFFATAAVAAMIGAPVAAQAQGTVGVVGGNDVVIERDGGIIAEQRPAFREYVKQVDALFEELLTAIDTETEKRLEDAEISGLDPSRRGATWTYITTDQPFGSWMQSALRDLLKKKTRRSGGNSASGR